MSSTLGSTRTVSKRVAVDVNVSAPVLVSYVFSTFGTCNVDPIEDALLDDVLYLQDHTTGAGDMDFYPEPLFANSTESARS